MSSYGITYRRLLIAAQNSSISDEIIELIEQIYEVLIVPQGFSITPELFDIYSENIIKCIMSENQFSPPERNYLLSYIIALKGFRDFIRQRVELAIPAMSEDEVYWPDNLPDVSSQTKNPDPILQSCIRSLDANMNIQLLLEEYANIQITESLEFMRSGLVTSARAVQLLEELVPHSLDELLEAVSALETHLADDSNRTEAVLNLSELIGK